MGDHSKWFGGAHALDGMVILLLSLGLAVAAWRSRPGGRGLAVAAWRRAAAARSLAGHAEKNLDHRP
jgi:hypothetical protein